VKNIQLTDLSIIDMLNGKFPTFSMELSILGQSKIIGPLQLNFNTYTSEILKQFDREFMLAIELYEQLFIDFIMLFFVLLVSNQDLLPF
jgi:hypothetical protein